MRRSVPLALLAATVAHGCGFVPRQVTADECTGFADRLAILAATEQDEAERACATRLDEPARDEAARAIAGLRADFLRICEGRIGDRYAPADAQCLREAKGLDALRACNFATPLFHEVTGALVAASTVVEVRCRAGSRGGPAASSSIAAPPRPDDDLARKKPDPKRKRADD